MATSIRGCGHTTEDMTREEFADHEAATYLPVACVPDREDDGDLPKGYRWADEDETERHGVDPIPGAIVVLRTVDSRGVPYTDEADLAVPE